MLVVLASMGLRAAAQDTLGVVDKLRNVLFLAATVSKVAMDILERNGRWETSQTHWPEVGLRNIEGGSLKSEVYCSPLTSAFCSCSRGRTATIAELRV